MIRRFASTLTAIAVLLHALLGCCCHHAHAAEDSPDALDFMVVETDDEVHHHCGEGLDVAAHDGHHQSEQHDRHRHSVPCDECDCSYVSSSKLSVESPLDSDWDLPLPCDSEGGPACTNLQGRRFADCPGGRCLARSLSLRALTQVWLV